MNFIKQLFKTAIILLVLIFASTIPVLAQDADPSAPTIQGGEEATPGQFPFVVRIGNYCNGVLIDQQWVLTASQCFNSIPDALFEKVVLGDHSLNTFEGADDAEQEIPILRAFQAPDVAPVPCPSPLEGACTSDSLLLQLAFPATLNDRVQPIAFNEDPAFRNDGRATLIGWGADCDTLTCASQDILRYYETDLNGSVGNTSEADAIDAASPDEALETGTNLNYGEIQDDGTYNPDNGLCAGDNGGPAVKVDDDGEFILLGVHVTGSCDDDNSFSTDTSLISDFLRASVESTGTLTIIKEAKPQDGTDFNFELAFTDASNTVYPNISFALDDDNDSTYENTFTTDLSAGTYVIGEKFYFATVWELGEITCDSDNATISMEDLEVTINMVENEDITCIFNNRKPTELGTISVSKETVPAYDTDFNFTFTGDDVSETFILDDDDETDGTYPANQIFVDLLPGNFSITEAEDERWELQSITCNIDESLYTVDLDNGTVDVDLAAQQDVLCTFTNKLLTGSITIQKVADPLDGTDFTFDYTNNIDISGSFILDDDGGSDDTNPQTETISDVPIGTYAFTELLPADTTWFMESVACVDQSQGITPVAVTSDLSAGTFEFDLAPSGEFVCTVTNKKPTKLTVVKETDDENGDDFSFTLNSDADGVGFISDEGFTTGLPTAFNLDTDDDATLSASQTFEFVTSGLQVFPVTLSEDELVHWDFESAVCINDATDAPVITTAIENGVTFDIDTGTELTCTFTNTFDPIGTITVNKTVNAEDGTDFDFTYSDGADITGGFTLDVDADATNENTITLEEMSVATYTFTEVFPAPWQMTDVSCVDQAFAGQSVPTTTDLVAGTIEFELTRGADVVCTVTNNKPTKLTVIKETDEDNGDDFTFLLSTDADGIGLIDADGSTVVLPPTFVLDTDADATFSSSQMFEFAMSGLDSFPIMLSEDELVQWNLESAVCVDDETNAPVTTTAIENGITFDIATGTELTCTFTNTFIPMGALTIVKQVSAEDGTDFDFTYTNSDDVSGDFTLDVDGDPTVANEIVLSELPIGTYTVTEIISVDSDWTLEAVTCEEDGVAVPFDFDEANNAISIDLVRDANYVCTFSNIDALPTGNLTIVKASDPEDGTDFSFTLTDGDAISDAFTLDVDNESDATFSHSTAFAELAIGQYTIAEALPEGWFLAGVFCDIDNSLYSVDLDNSTLDITLEEMADVTCTFTNAIPDPTITIVKKATPADGTNFEFVVMARETDSDYVPILSPVESSSLADVVGTFFLDDTVTDDGDEYQSAREFFLPPGVTYSFTESEIEGWTLVNLSCDSNDSDKIDVEDSTVSVTLDYGDDITCTFLNDGNPTSVALSKSTAKFQSSRLVASLVFALVVVLVPVLNVVRKRRNSL